MQLENDYYVEKKGKNVESCAAVCTKVYVLKSENENISRENKNR